MNVNNFKPIFQQRRTTMRILFINNNGAGFADYIDIQDNMTVEAFFIERMPGCHESDYLIRVNRQPVPRDYLLQENDRITVTPVKIEGAA
jgi:sulfur carrier protein ThiS